jgi:Cys-tRNA(Pro)/Cys-tRNA(Cys) deacylase
MSDKTLAMKLLEKQGVDFEVVTYPPTERDAEKLAVLFGVPAAEVFKTLVVGRNPQKPLLVMIPADRQLDLKKLAKAMGDKKLKMATHSEAERLTGLQVGGISPLALLNKGFVMLIDVSAENHTHVFVSAGQKGINLRVPVADLLRITRARKLDVT